MIIPRVLSIAGTDPTGGAGIQADLKSVAAHGGYGMAVVTALVAQNTHGVHSVHVPPVEFLREQLKSVSDDVTIDAVKLGMLGNVGIVEVVDMWLADVNPPVVVMDPVMVATSGDRLLDLEAEDAVIRLLDRVHLVTPNLAELGVLLKEPTAETWSEALAQGRRLSAEHDVIVLVKGGHLEGEMCPDALVDDRGGSASGQSLFEVTADRVDTVNTHGTGCSMSSAMATLKARGGNWNEALTTTKAWLQDSLTHADDLHVGSGRGPIHHFHQLWTAACP